MAAFLAPGISRRSLFGIAFVAALAVVGLFLLFDHNQTDAANGDQIRLGNALAAELQSAALTAQGLNTLDVVEARRERARLRENIAQLSRLHAELRGSDGQPRPRRLSAEALALFLDPPGRIDQTLRTYIADLIVIAAADGQGSTARQAATRAVLAKAEPLRDSLADFVRHIEAERASNIRRLLYLLGGVLAVIILLVLAGGLGVVRPVLNASARARTRLRASQIASERAREQIISALDSVSYGIALFDAANRLVVANQAFHTVYRSRGWTISPGTRYDELLNEIVERELIPEAAAKGQIWVQDQLDRHNSVHSEATWRFADGEEIGMVETMTKDGGTVVVQHEVATLDRIPGSLAPSDAQVMVEGSVDGLIKVDAQGSIHAVNARLCTMFGGSAKEAVGRNVSFFFVGRDFADFFNGGADPGKMYTAKGRHADGGEIPVEVAVTQGPRQGAGGDSYILTVRDIRGPAQVSDPLLQVQRMEAIGTLAGGVAHDFNNILSIIMGYSALLGEDLPDSGELRENLDMVERAAHRARGLVEQILSFSRAGEPVMRPIVVQPVIEEGLKLMRSTLPATIEIRSDIDAGMAKVRVDPSQLQQVLVNLCTNGAHAIGDSGRDASGTIEVGLCEVLHRAAPGARSKNFPAGLPEDLPSGQYLQLSVRDDGGGMDAATAEQVFEPFFTTKDRGRGSGLGLSVVHGIVVGCGGVVTAKSAPGEGATFDVYLPIYDGEDPAVADAALVEVPKGRGRILFVDDEEPLVRLGEKILGKLGYDVEGATGGEEALRVFSRDPQGFDLVITDQTMPGITGENLVAAIHKLRDDIPAILCTGYSQDVGEDEARALSIEAFLMKPLESGELGWAVARALDLAPAS